ANLFLAPLVSGLVADRPAKWRQAKNRPWLDPDLHGWCAFLFTGAFTTLRFIFGTRAISAVRKDETQGGKRPGEEKRAPAVKVGIEPGPVFRLPPFGGAIGHQPRHQRRQEEVR